MSKWVFALAAGIVVVVGCSGGGGSGGGGIGGGGGTDSNAFVTIPNVPGQLQSVYLSGQGRSVGDWIAVIRRLSVDDTAGSVSTLLNPFRRVQLNGYTQQMIALNVPTTVSRPFNHYNLEILRVDQDNGDGTFTPLDTVPSVLNFIGDPTIPGNNGFDAYYRLFPGRNTSMTVRLDDSMFVEITDINDPNFGKFQFDAARFQTANFSVVGLEAPKMNGFISDYIMFDLSNMSPADQPVFPDASGTATAVFFNGDNFAIGQAPIGPPDQSTADPLPFFAILPSGFVEGLHVGPRTAIDPGTGQSSPIPGTYSLVQADPRVPMNPLAKITALQGTYKNYSKTINSLGNNPQGFEIIAFPSRLDDGIDDIVCFNISGSVITNVYFGQIDMNAGTLSAFPVAQIIDPENTANEITGTISNLDSGDVTTVRQGHYDLNGTNLPGSFSTSGRFIVYRR